MKYSRVLLKISGEFLGNGSESFEGSKLKKILSEVFWLKQNGKALAIVVGGGNIVRGCELAHLSLDRSVADNVGMLSTLMNAILVSNFLNKNSIKSVVLSSFQVDKICDFYTRDKAIEYIKNGFVVICAGGIANPYFSTDTAAVIRALELNMDIVIKGTQVEGVYDKDPKKFTDAKKYTSITHDVFIQENLAVMDLASVVIAKDNNLPLIVFNFHKNNAIEGVFVHNSGSFIGLV